MPKNTFFELRFQAAFRRLGVAIMKRIARIFRMNRVAREPQKAVHRTSSAAWIHASPILGCVMAMLTVAMVISLD